MMKISSLRLALIVSDRVYRGLIFLFPPAFRGTFGPRMAGVFRQCCREAAQREGLRGLFSLWLLTLVDFAINLVPEWKATLHTHFSEDWPALLSAFVGVLAGYVYLHADTTQELVVPFVVCFGCAGLLGYLRPSGAKEWPLLIGAGVPYVFPIDVVMNYHPPCQLYLVATLLAGLTALVGALGGVALEAIHRRWRQMAPIVNSRRTETWQSAGAHRAK